MITWMVVAFAGDVEDLREDLGGGAAVNWTTLTLEVTRVAHPRGIDASRRVVEHEAGIGLGEAVRSAATHVRLTSDETLGARLGDPTLGPLIGARVERWSMGETRYATSGRVEVVGSLSLFETLRPWTQSVAIERPEEVREPAFTGLLVDARGSGARAAFAPRLLGVGQVLWDGAMWADAALARSPVVYVPDPAHAAVARVGERPLIVHASSAEGADLVLDELDAVRFRSGFADTGPLRAGTVVVVLDP
jgi:hypothetical protein